MVDGALEFVTFGESMALLLGEPALPLTETPSFRRSVAGAESNVAIGLARLGHRVGWFGRVGTDALGRVVLRTLRAEAVDVSRAVADDAPTGVLIRDCHGERATEVVYYRDDSAGSRLSESDVDADYIAQARILHVTGITPLLSESAYRATVLALDVARDAGVPVCFDPNVRRSLRRSAQAKELLRPIAARASIVLSGLDEGRLLSGADDHGSIARWFHDQGAQLVVTKDGVRGSRVSDGGNEWCQEATPVRTIDPVGAGDAFAAGFLSAWMRSEPIARALHEATAVAALAVQSPGDYEGLPTLAQRDSALREPTELVHR